MLRRLLNIASIVCLVVCVALMGMWVFSSVCDEAVHGSLTDAVGDFQIASIQGRLSILTLPSNKRPGVGYWPQTPLDDHKSHVGEPPIHYEYETITPSNWLWSPLPRGKVLSPVSAFQRHTDARHPGWSFRIGSWSSQQDRWP